MNCISKKKHEKSIEIPIIKKKHTENSKNINNYEHSLTQNFFDPTNSSPPNHFIIKLHARIYAYNYNHETKVDNFINE